MLRLQTDVAQVYYRLIVATKKLQVTENTLSVTVFDFAPVTKLLVD